MATGQFTALQWGQVAATTAERDVDLMGIGFDAVTETQLIGRIVDSWRARRGGFVITANLDHLRRAVYQPDYRVLTRQAAFVVADGMPVVWASTVQGQPLPERVAGSSLITPLSRALGRHNGRVFFLGGEPGSAEQAANHLRKTCPGLQVAGTASPHIDLSNSDQLDAIKAQLRQAQPDFVYVALGSPKQEFLIRELHSALPHMWWLGVGISFSFLTGRVRRAPQWMQQLGLEWVHRLWQEPRRLARRYLVHDLPFAFHLFCHALAVFVRGHLRAGSRRPALNFRGG